MEGGLFMANINNSIKNMILWFNKLEENKKVEILNYVEINSIFKLQDEELTHIKVFREYVRELIMQQDDKIIIMERLTKSGFEEDSARKLLYATDKYINITNDSKSIINMEPSRFEELIKFIISKVILYREFNYIPFNKFVEEFNFINKKEANEALRYIHHNIILIVSRKISLETSKEMLTRQYDIPEEMVDIFYKGVNDNIKELREAYLFQRLNEVGTMLKDLSDNLSKPAT